MKYLKSLFVNSLLLTFANCHLVKRGTGSIDDFTPYPEVKKVIEENTKTYRYDFYDIFKDGPIYTGEATAYGSEKSDGNCSYPTAEYYEDMMYAAINSKQYKDDLGCGACAVVISTEEPYKPIRIRVIDKCPECKHGDLDLSDKAYRALVNKDPGRKKITWALIPCDVEIAGYPPLIKPGENIKFSFKSGSSKDWTEIKVYDTRYPVAKFAVKVDGKYIQMARRNYNYWHREGHPALGEGPFDFRVELADDSIIEATGVEMKPQKHDEDSIYSTGKQTFTKSPGKAGYIKRLFMTILKTILIVCIVLLVLLIALLIYRKFYRKGDSTSKKLPSFPKVKNPLQGLKKTVPKLKNPSIKRATSSSPLEEVTTNTPTPKEPENKPHLSQQYADRLIM
ncbi:carbohydrate-binding module family 63 protein [Piromyces sp. E2]|nr:carbohydrate-binding module family 63 protein [Piromyces sp. E2]|eukprot:OUM64896.1 carbohydrate-binding module family 63 protein [Piromyces sp. E2]